MSAIVGMQRWALAISLAATLHANTLTAANKPLVSRRQHPTAVPSFTNIRKPPPQPGWFRSSATVAFVFRRHPERSEGLLYLLFIFAVALVLLAFLAVIPKGNRLTSSLHAALLKNRVTQRP
jgi:hypothetical protein